MKVDDYSDIIDLPHHESISHPKMDMIDRAAQFSPFAALVGFEGVLAESTRETEAKRLSSADKTEEMERKLNLLSESSSKHPDIRVTYFVKDDRKEGGHYLTYEGKLSKVDVYDNALVFLGGFRIAIKDVYELESDLFPSFF